MLTNDANDANGANDASDASASFEPKHTRMGDPNNGTIPSHANPVASTRFFQSN
jgi:hypothetical protein